MAVANAHRRQHQLAVLFFDLDRFKLINDSLAIRQVIGCCRRWPGGWGLRCGRGYGGPLGGDEFIVLCPSWAEAATRPRWQARC